MAAPGAGAGLAATTTRAREGIWGEALMFPCPCCDYLTLRVPMCWEVCPVCYWEDDPGARRQPEMPSGPNGALTLAEARANYARIGACSPGWIDDVRAPFPAELPHSA